MASSSSPSPPPKVAIIGAGPGKRETVKIHENY